MTQNEMVMVNFEQLKDYEKKEIEKDIAATVFDLYHYCEKYEALIKSYDDEI